MVSVLLLPLAIGCASSLEEDADPGLALRAEFLHIAERIRNSAHPYLGEVPLQAVEQQLASRPLSRARHFSLLSKLATQKLNSGESVAAVEAVEKALRILNSIAPAARQSPENVEALKKLLKFRAIAYLRSAEDRNCVNHHTRQSCIFPLSGQGIHQYRRAAQEARNSLLHYLRIDPDDPGARWMLNLVAMALDEYPAGVPLQHLINVERFQADAEVARFVDIATEIGVDTFNLCGGVAVEDFDGDGRLDIVTSTYDPDGPLTYYRNQGNGTFQDQSSYSGLIHQLGGLNLMATDYNNDGLADLLVLRGAWMSQMGRIRNSLLRNNGDGTFSDVTRQARLAEPALPTQAAVWFDFDNDGDLDLYVGNELPAPGQLRPTGQLFRNNDDGTFTDVAEAAGVTNGQISKGVAAGDYDNDGDMDLYVSNIGPNRMYRNNGDGTFTNVALDLGVTGPEGRSFATWFFDYNNDGWLDLFVAAYNSTIDDLSMDYMGTSPRRPSVSRLYQNNGGTFTEVGSRVGLNHPYLPMGANFGDVNNDGFLDIYLGTGDPLFQSLMPNVLLLNDGGSRFLDVTHQSGLGHLQKGHGIAFADFDHDGDQDIYHQLGGFYRGDGFGNAFFLNPGHTGHRFVKIQLVGTQSNRPGVGARLRIVVRDPEGSREIHRSVGSVSSFGGSPLFRQEIGLGNAVAIERIDVLWPASGTHLTYTSIPLDSFIEITEGSPVAKNLSLRPIHFPVEGKRREIARHLSRKVETLSPPGRRPWTP